MQTEIVFLDFNRHNYTRNEWMNTTVLRRKKVDYVLNVLKLLKILFGKKEKTYTYVGLSQSWIVNIIVSVFEL